ncbi:MAG: hypothetical protein WDM84_08495 [Bauldia sp.]
MAEAGLAMALPDRSRRAVALTGLNVLAVGLALGALHVAGVVVSGTGQQPLIAAVDPRGDALGGAAALPRAAPRVPIALTAVADAETLFAQPAPEAAPLTTEWSGGTTGGFVAPAPVAAPQAPTVVAVASNPAPVAPRSAPVLADILPPVGKIVGVAERGRVVGASLQQATAPLVEVADNSLDLLMPGGRASVSGDAGGGAISVTAGGQASVGAPAQGLTQTVAQATQPVTQTVAQATEPVTQTVSHVVSSVGGLLR